MKKHIKIVRPILIKISGLAVLILVLSLFHYREEIRTHKVTKAKIEMFKRMLHTEPDAWPGEFKEVYDSLIVQEEDSLNIWINQ